MFLLNIISTVHVWGNIYGLVIVKNLEAAKETTNFEFAFKEKIRLIINLKLVESNMTCGK